MKAHISPAKKERVKEIEKLLAEYPVIAAIDITNLPAQQFQTMRATLRKKNCIIRVDKGRLVKKAIDAIKDKKQDIDKLSPYIKGMPALLFTKEDPFKIYSIIQKSKSKAPAKGGQIAPYDILVPAGPTNFAPGPIIGELGAFKIKAGIDKGKVVIKEDSIAVKEGEVISPKLAGVLARLEIKPMDIGLNITGVYQDGMIYTKEILSIDEDQIRDMITQAQQYSFNLAIEAKIFTKDTTEMLLTKAHSEARALAIAQDILTSETVEILLAKAQNQMLEVKNQLNI